MCSPCEITNRFASPLDDDASAVDWAAIMVILGGCAIIWYFVLQTLQE